jgi:bifunctional non-homologous end joining protein LigD
MASQARIERAGVELTHPDRVLFSGPGLTKADLAAYYEAVAERMLPTLRDRPLTLVRCPPGRGRTCFVQKHDTGGFPDAMRRVAVTEASGETENYFFVSDLSGLIAGGQMGVLEFHVWGARRDDLEKAERIVFDLDPDVGLGFEAVCGAAFELRDRLAALGLTTFPMLTGGKGVHVVAPLSRRAGWDDAKAFAKGLTARLDAEAPERFTISLAKAARAGRIFIDYLRNQRGATAIAPYSTRAKPDAPVAAPVSWEELERIGAANAFTVPAMIGRARSDPDPWAGYGDVRQSLTKAMLAAVGD